MGKSKLANQINANNFDCFYDNLVSNILSLMGEKRLNQTDIAKMLHTAQSNVSFKIKSRVDKGNKSVFTLEQLFLIAKYFNVDFADLVKK